ncbi:MAG: ATP-binding protein [Lachnospiraceae bacterium]|nr:ATP-binding protein [Lachnospiraceae bacterium]
MNHIIPKLIMYGNMSEDSILLRLGQICADCESKTVDTDTLRVRLFGEVKRLLELGTSYGFDNNLWHNYLTFIMITQENPFTITCEKIGAGDGSVNNFAMNDFTVFYELFHYDFAPLEATLGTNVFDILTDYRAIVKPELMYNKNVSEKVRALSLRLEAAEGPEGFFNEVCEFYRAYGVGMFGLNKAFRIEEKVTGGIEFLPINNMDTVTLDDLVGYESQKKRLIENTEAFVEGRGANNVLLYGDSGTGKSTSIKAIVNQFYDRGLRMIEIYKHQFKDLSAIIAAVKNRNYRFIIYMDDLSFEEFEIEYKFLKAVIEGGVETKPANVLIYATSNRRHIIKETWSDRDDVVHDNGIHKSDTMEEKLSLVNRFGVTIYYGKPAPKEFYVIVGELAKRAGIDMDEQALYLEANKWEMNHGGLSGRTATQFITYLKGKNNGN